MRAAIEGVAGQPDQLRTQEAEPTNMLHLLAQRGGRDTVPQADGSRTVVDFTGYDRTREVLPNELQHEQLVEVGIEQRTHDGIELPVVVVRALGKVHIHGCL